MRGLGWVFVFFLIALGAFTALRWVINTLGVIHP